MTAVFQRASPYMDDALNLPVRDVDGAVPYYEAMFGFRVVSRQEAPVKSAIMARDDIRIQIAENGGDPEKEGCFFQVDNVETAFAELKANGLSLGEPNFRIDKHGEFSYRVFFVIAPDGLCYCLGDTNCPQ